ncbi:MAG TPA: hypothetical protein ACFYD4_04095, partial [Candidatus Wunengus sp. YC61]|uniref:hypothetical protein n=1 Tax=Candidatus Wunengus sp. YC61 TaxID=3367698 RepID=UPI00402518F5
NNTNSNFELKLKHLGERYEDANRFFKFTLSVITGTIVILGIILAYFSIASKKEVADAIREMDRKFEVLSQQALKLPRLEVFYKDELVSGKTITIPLSGDTVALNKLSIKNIGEKIANDITIKIYFNNLADIDPYFLRNAGFGGWDISASSYEAFPWVIKSKGKLSLSPQEAWEFPVLVLDLVSTYNNGKHMDEILLDTLMKVEVYYGLEKPIITEIKFEKSKR